MIGCDQYQHQFLHHLYGLLDEAEAQGLEAHLAACPVCQAAWTRVGDQKKLLARAAKSAFPAVKFVPPPAEREATTLPMRSSVRPASRRFALAACMILLAGLGIPAGWWATVTLNGQKELGQIQDSYQLALAQAEQDSAARKASIEQVKGSVHQAEQAVAKVQQQGQARLQGLQTARNALQMQVRVSGPETILPGGRNEYQIHTSNLNNQVVPARLTARVLDNATHKVVFEEKDIVSPGDHRLSLPPNLPLKPGSDLALEVVARKDGSGDAEVKAKLELATPVYLTHLTTDKPMYRPGETVHFRSLTLDRFSLKPAAEVFRLVYTLLKPNGEEAATLSGVPTVINEQTKAPLLGPDGKAIQGIGAGEFRLDPSWVGGEYTLKITERNQRFPEQTRKFVVNKYENPRLNKELDFTRKSYGPGDEVVAACKASPAGGGAPVAHRPVEVAIQIDGKWYGSDGKEGMTPFHLQTDANGTVNVRFMLPKTIERGLATVSVKFVDRQGPETLVKPIPIALKKLDIEFFPEGGDLVAGLSNRVYFQARTTLGKPAEIKGRILDQDGKLIATTQTLNDDKEPGANQGMGAFDFTPRAGRKYQLRIDSPSGIEGSHELPLAKDDGIVLSVPHGVVGPKDTVPVFVRSGKQDRELLVGLYCRGRLLDHQTVKVKAGTDKIVELRAKDDAGGVCRVTVFEEELHIGRQRFVPRAERLIYRAPTEQLILTARPDKKQYIPGEQVKISLQALNENEKSAPAIVMVAVVDKSVITLADEKTARTMPTHYLLTTEVRRPEDLEYADFLLGKHPKAAAALDLLLGTQGWRRFAEQNPTQFPARFKDETDHRDAERLLASMGQSIQRDVDLNQLEIHQAEMEYAKELVAAVQKQVEAEQAWQSLASDQKPAERVKAEISEARAFERKFEDSREHLQTQDSKARGAVTFALFGAGGMLLILSAVLASSLRKRAMYFVGTIGGAMACVGGGCYLSTTVDACGFAACPAELDESRLLALANAPAGEVQAALEPQSRVRTATGADRGKDRFMDEGRPENVNQPPGWGAPGGMGVSMGGVPAAAAAEAMPPAAFDKRAKDNLREELADNEVKKDGKRNFYFGKQEDQPLALGAKMGGLNRARGDDKGAQPAKAKKPMGQLRLLQEVDAVGQKREGEQARRVPERERMELDKKGMAPQLGVVRGNLDPKLVEDVLRGMEERRGEIANGALAPAQQQQQLQAGLRQRELLRDRLVFPEAQGGMAGGRAQFGLNGRAGFGGGGLGGMEGVGRPDRMVFGHGDQGELFKRRLANGAQELAQAVEPLPEPMVVREYAHQHPTGGPADIRTDFVDTVYWHPMLVLPDGKADVSFGLSDSVTTYQLTAYAHTLDGRLGSLQSTIDARLPFSLEPRLPIEVTASDKIDLPVSIANNTSERRPVNITLTPGNLKLMDGKLTESLNIDADGRTRHVYRLQPTVVEGEARVTLEGQSAPFSDSVSRTFSIVPDGFPVAGSHSDMLEGVARKEIVLPDSWVKGTLKCQVNVFPSTLADLQKGLEALIREPGGCFEQTSTSNYPNLLILDYLRETDQSKPQLEKDARDKLARGYAILTSYECQEPGNPRRGYEWFGGASPAHEALTAYGLLEFRDMARVHNVDMKMVERTRTYLMSRKDGQGGFLRNPRALDSFGGAPKNITDAYIVWAITESSKDDDVEKELAALRTQAGASKDPYFLSLVATSLINRGKLEDGVALLKTVASVQKEDGHLDATDTSITHSGGRDLEIETTALAVLGWLKANRPGEFNMPIQKAVKWLGQQRGGYGGFGSTQSTILTLKALIGYAKANKKTPEAGALTMYVGEKQVGSLHFEPNVQDALTLTLPDAEQHLKSGKNLVRIAITGKNVFPYTLSWTYQTLQPASADRCAVRLETRLDRQAAMEGDTVHLSIAVENTQDKGQGMAVAIVGLPAGLTLPEDMKQLKDHARLRNNGLERGLISHWEIRGREVILYWRDLAPRQKIEVPLDLICRVPGEYSGPASRAYLYYNADVKHWVAPLRVQIKPNLQ